MKHKYFNLIAGLLCVLAVFGWIALPLQIYIFVVGLWTGLALSSLYWYSKFLDR